MAVHHKSRSFSCNYILDKNGTPVPEPDFRRWSAWFDNRRNRILRCDELPGQIRVSTVFLGIDHNLRDRGPPVLWQTTITGGDHNGYSTWFTSHRAALEGHQAAVKTALRGPSWES